MKPIISTGSSSSIACVRWRASRSWRSTSGTGQRRTKTRTELKAESRGQYKAQGTRRKAETLKAPCEAGLHQRSDLEKRHTARRRFDYQPDLSPQRFEERLVCAGVGADVEFVRALEMCLIHNGLAEESLEHLAQRADRHQTQSAASCVSSWSVDATGRRRHNIHVR